MNFNEIYLEAVKYAKTKISFSKTNLSPEDLVSEAYLLCEGEPTLELLKEGIRKFLNSQKYNYLHDLKKYNIHHHTLDKQCTKCREVLPIAYFRVYKYEHYAVHGNICNECRKAKGRISDKKYYAANRDARRERKKEWYKKHAGRVSQYSKKNIEKRKECKCMKRGTNKEKFSNVSIKSGVKNIYFDRFQAAWVVRKIIKGKRITFGTSVDLEKAKSILNIAMQKDALGGGVISSPHTR